MNRSQRTESRLHPCKNSVDSMVYDARRAFQMLASRPIHPETEKLLEASHGSMQKHYLRNDMHLLLRHEAFNGELQRVYSAVNNVAHENSVPRP